jgi:hypothetical protein
MSVSADRIIKDADKTTKKRRKRGGVTYPQLLAFDYHQIHGALELLKV